MTDRRANREFRAIIAKISELDRKPLLEELRERGRVIEAQAALIQHLQQELNLSREDA